MDPEKPEIIHGDSISNSGKSENGAEIEAVAGKDGYVLNDASLAHDRGLKTTQDGGTILIPQPSDSPNDPLNWTQFRKNTILIIISCTAFLPDYGSATGSVTLTPQGEYVPCTCHHDD